MTDYFDDKSWEGDSDLFLRVLWSDPQERPMYGTDLVGSLWNIELLYDFALLLGIPPTRTSP